MVGSSLSCTNHNEHTKSFPLLWYFFKTLIIFLSSVRISLRQNKTFSVWLEQSQKEKNVRDRTKEGTHAHTHKKSLWDIFGQHGNLGFIPNIASLVVT